MPCVHRGAGRSSPCTSSPAWVSPAACPAGIPARAQSPRCGAFLRSRMAVVRYLSKTAVWSLRRDAPLQTKQWLLGWMVGARLREECLYRVRLLPLREGCYSRLSQGTGLSGTRLPSHPHAHPGRAGDTLFRDATATDACSVRAYTHTTIVSRRQHGVKPDADRQILLWSTWMKLYTQSMICGRPSLCLPSPDSIQV